MDNRKYPFPVVTKLRGGWGRGWNIVLLKVVKKDYFITTVRVI